MRLSSTLTLATTLLLATTYLANIVQAEEPASAIQFLKAMEKKKTLTLEPIFRACVDFEKRSTSLPPKEAAKQWLELMDQYFVAARQAREFNTSDYQKVIGVIPRPDSWEEIVFSIRNRKSTEPKTIKQERALRILAAVLEGNNTVVRKETEDYAKDFTDKPLADCITPILDALNSSPIVVTEVTGQKMEHVVSQLRDQIKKVIAGNGTEGNGFLGYLFPLPDLVSDINVLRTIPFLKKIFTTAPLEFSIPRTSKTFPVAQRVVREQIDQLKAPQWSLAHCIDNIEIFEALTQRFPPPKLQKPTVAEASIGSNGPSYSSTQRKALSYYILSLALKGKMKEALGHLEANATQADNGLFGETYGQSMNLTDSERKVVFGLLKTVLTKNPNLGLWSSFTTIGTQFHQIGQNKSLLLKASYAHNLDPNIRGPLEDALYLAYSENEQIEEAVALLRTIEARPKPANGTFGGGSYTSMYGPPLRRLITLGQLYQRPEWIKDGVQFAINLTKAQAFSPESIMLVPLFIQLGRPQEALQYLWSQTKNGLEPWKISQELGEQLLTCYHATQRYSDAVLILDRFTGWQMGDLAHTGRAKEAIPILQSLLPQVIGYYSQYPAGTLLDTITLLIRLQPDQTGVLLEKLSRLYRDTSALLLGRAMLAQKQGKTAEAEQYARDAWNRLRYAPSAEEKTSLATCRFLSSLSSIKQDKRSAEVFRNNERGILLFQQAKQLQRAGILPKAYQLYQEAVSLAPDVVGLRSLAGKLAEQMAFAKEAEAHYQRLAELQVEDDQLSFPPNPSDYSDSNNYDWATLAGWYTSSPLQSAVTTRICKAKLAKEPNHVQAHVVLGNMFAQQGQTSLAYEEFQQATKIQPKHAQAWQQMLNIASISPNSYPHIEEVALQLFHLEPARGTYSGILSKIDNLHKLWKVVQEVQPLLLPEVPESLYVLTESKHALESQNQTQGTHFSNSGAMLQLDRGVPTPGQAIAMHKLVQPVSLLILTALYNTRSQ